MNLLALETSSPRLSVALWRSGTVTERHGSAGVVHSEEILGLMGSLLCDAGLNACDMDAVAFSAGPGGFTGVRLGCAVAQGLAMAAGLPVVAIGSLEALALETGAQRVYACVDARMNEVYCAAFERSGIGLKTLLEPRVLPAEAAPKPPGENWTLCGSGFSAYAGRFPEWLAEQGGRPDQPELPRAEWVARAAAERVLRGEVAPASQAAPVYVRDKVALTVRERVARGGHA